MTFFALSPSVWMMTPQLTEQYGQVLRVSVVWEILRVLAWASSGVTSNPKTVIAAPPAMDVCRKARRDKAIVTLRPQPFRAQPFYTDTGSVVNRRVLNRRSSTGSRQPGRPLHPKGQPG